MTKTDSDPAAAGQNDRKCVMLNLFQHLTFEIIIPQLRDRNDRKD
jgi:hypothetical protein